MARMLRLEFPGAIYHVINRGNYREDVFAREDAKAAFTEYLLAACQRFGWRLHAFVALENHYRLAIETPQGNLSAGMQWLQSTFAGRFNRLRGERGHLFQGRFKALLVEAGHPLGQVAHDIHLSPAKAGVVAMDALATYRYSSYWYGMRPEARSSFMTFAAALAEGGEFRDTEDGWRAYADYLGRQMAEGLAGKKSGDVSLSAGWAIGSAAFKQELIKKFMVWSESRGWQDVGLEEVRMARWAAVLARCLAVLPEEVRAGGRKSAPWKVAVASHLKETTDARNGWLASQLGMGSPIYVSKHVGLLLRSRSGEAQQWLDFLRLKLVEVAPALVGGDRNERVTGDSAGPLERAVRLPVRRASVPAPAPAVATGERGFVIDFTAQERG